MGVTSSKHKEKKAANKTMTLEEKEANSHSRLEILWEMKKKTQKSAMNFQRRTAQKLFRKRIEKLTEIEEV